MLAHTGEPADLFSSSIAALTLTVVSIPSMVLTIVVVVVVVVEEIKVFFTGDFLFNIFVLLKAGVNKPSFDIE